MQSTARVRTQTPGRYAKQLLSHLSRRAESETYPSGASDAADITGGRLVFADGVGTLQVDADQLTLHAAAGTREALAHVQDVLGRHLVRFGTRDELVVEWGDPVDG